MLFRKDLLPLEIPIMDSFIKDKIREIIPLLYPKYTKEKDYIPKA
jgi:hypothetical protein